jgi:hypothetical protein
MPGLEDGIIKSHPLTTLGLAAVTVVPLVFPTTRRAWGRGLKAAAMLYVEAEAGAEADIVDSLAETTLDQLVEALAQPEAEARHEQARAVIGRYTKRARHRAARHGRSDDDRQRRYARHIHALKKRISHRRAAATSDDRRKRWDHVLSALDDAAASLVGPAPAAPHQGEADHGVH